MKEKLKKKTYHKIFIDLFIDRKQIIETYLELKITNGDIQKSIFGLPKSNKGAGQNINRHPMDNY